MLLIVFWRSIVLFTLGRSMLYLFVLCSFTFASNFFKFSYFIFTQNVQKSHQQSTTTAVKKKTDYDFSCLTLQTIQMQDNSQSENNFEDQNDIEIPYIISISKKRTSYTRKMNFIISGNNINCQKPNSYINAL